MKLIRKLWFRVLVVNVVIAGGLFLLALTIDTSWFQLRNASLLALQSVTLVYAVLSALSIALYSNYIKGIRENYIKQTLTIRDLLEKFFDEYATSEDDDIQEIIAKVVYPLLQYDNDEWLDYDSIKAIRVNINTPAERLITRKMSWLLTRHLVRLENGLNELGLMFIRRIITKVNIDLIRGTFTLIVLAVISIALAHLLPNYKIINAVIVVFNSVMITWACIQILLILSFFEQEAINEIGDSVSD